ncbi:hypothetical protein MMC25_002083 [Agyrium rufum]|nr:hypothetical protein [Agyrium rufum]
MRRAAVQAFRTARRAHGRKTLTPKTFSTWSARYVSAPRTSRLPIRREEEPLRILQSSLLFRNFSVFAASALVATGAWYTLGPTNPSSDIANRANSPQSLHTPAVTVPTSGYVPAIQATTSATSLPSSQTAQITTSALEEPVKESTRRALVVENDQFYTGELAGDEPLSKVVDDSGRKVLEMLTSDQATEKLRQNEDSYLVGRGRGVVRYDVVQLASNDPIEDDHAEKIVEMPQTVAATQDGSPSSDWMFWGVFDGHSGWPTSARLRQSLISFVARELNATYKSALTDPSLTIPTPEAIDTAIKQGFIRLDNEIVNESVEKVLKSNSKRMGAELLAPALSGSCALLSFYDSKSKLLRVACTGDSRAVLGRRGASGKWIATALSEDQTGGTPSEDLRLRREHPGEDYVTRNGRVFGGLEPSRAFGDAVYKWTREVQLQIKKSYFGKTPSPLLKTPPYVTAEPVVTTTKVDPSKGDFVVMATDGLWECLTNEEVVGLVGQWLESQKDSKNNSWLGGWFSSQSNALPVEKGEAGTWQKKTLRMDQWGLEGTDDRFIVEDKNVATHLVRNALGGKDRDMVCALLTLPSPYSRRYRDDLTVEVIFFGDNDKSGSVVQNMEASAAGRNTKAKL